MPYITIPTGSMPEAVAIGDVNGDGKNDVVLVTSSYLDPGNDCKLFVFLQNAAGGLDPPIKYSTSGTNSNPPRSVAIGDLNHDGRNDIIVGNSGAGIQVFLQNASGWLDPGITYASSDSDKVKIADVNHDGLMDVIGIGWGTNTVSVWKQNGSGSLDPPQAYAVNHNGYDDLDVGDVNNDGLIDIVVSSGQGLNTAIGVLTGKPNGTFNVPVYYSTYANSVAVGDVNGDNLNDIAVGSAGVFYQNSSGTMSALYPHNFDQAIAISDVNNDGRKDVISLRWGWSSVSIYLQKSDGTLQAEDQYVSTYGGWNPDSLAIGDINGDGFNDIVIADQHGLTVLYNRGAPGVSEPAASVLKTKKQAIVPVFKGVKLKSAMGL